LVFAVGGQAEYAASMVRKSASTTATGGRGYTFADKVAAGFLAQMLKRRFPLEIDLGVIRTLHFETRDAGHVLDDLRLVIKRGQDETRCLVSVKSNRQLTKAGFNSGFVQDAWDEWDGAGGSKFDRGKDILGLVVGVIDEPTLHEWQELVNQAATTTPERLCERLRNNGQSSTSQRAIFKSLRRASNGNERDAVETAGLVSRTRVLRFTDASEGDYVNLCAEIVNGGKVEEAGKLWSRLLELASKNRVTGGYFDLAKLVGVLRPDFELRDYPDFRSAWEKIEAVSQENIKGVRSIIGNGIQLSRDEDKSRLAAEVRSHNSVIVSGESGSGKSAIISQLTNVGGDFKRTLWLSPQQLSKPSQAEVATAFNLDHVIPKLITNSGIRGCVLLLDAFEGFEGEARSRAIELLRAVREEGFVGWKVIVSCQPQALKLVVDALAEAGITQSSRVDFEKPKLQEISDAVASIPGMRPLLLRTELQPILRNLMILDWVLRADVPQRFSAMRPWIGETEIIDCIWERWQGQDTKKHARDALLRALGEREGERLSAAVHVAMVPSTELPLLGELENEGLIRVSGPSVRFAHDLMGDWARYRVLKLAGDDAPVKIKELAHIPRWGRAIRLYGQSLAEHGTGLDKWRAATAEVSGEDTASKLASDLFLDSLVFAANSEYLLELVWPDLIAEQGQILHRLLKRLMHVASFPDWRFRSLIDARFAEQSEAWFRIPHPLYWIPVLRVLQRHSAEVARFGLISGAEVCALWLRTMPVGMPGRREAGLLAIALATEAQDLVAEGMHFNDRGKGVYEALLSAAPEFPDEVAQIALELCGRRDEPEHAIERRSIEDERRARLREEWRKKNLDKERARIKAPAGLGSWREGTMRAAATDGPSRSVSDGFRTAVMETAALNGLISSRPETAREVLLAVCIEEPTRWDPHNRDILMQDRLGLSDWQRGYPAMYWKGPFLRFLQESPTQGLDAIIRLVNYATERWLEAGLGPNVTEDSRKDYRLEFEFKGKRLLWVGDGNVCGWNRYLPMQGDTIECALMALEKWLYDELENRRSITPWVNHIFNHGTSLAFAGLLVSVGLKFQGLFASDLQPLLGNYYLYQWQLSMALGEHNGTWKISWGGQPESAVKLAAAWHEMRHRRILLRDVASTLMLQDEGSKGYVSARKAEWAKLPLNEKGQQDREFFLAHFDPANYTETLQDDGRVLITMSFPGHLQKIAEELQQENNLGMLALSLAQRARRLLEEQDTLRPEDVQGFAEQVRQLTNWKDSRNGGAQDHYRIDSIAGGLAVLVIRHRQWLSNNPVFEKWCLQTLQNLNPVQSEHASPVSISDHGAEIFLGEAGVALLPERSDEWVLRLAFNGVTGWEYNSTLFTTWRAYLISEKLGDRFGELLNVVIIWSALRRAGTGESGYYGDGSQLEKYRCTLFKRLVAGRLKGPTISFERAGILGRRLVERIELRSMSSGESVARAEQRKWAREQRSDRRLYREMADLDFQVIQKGFGFTVGMLRHPVTGEEKHLQRFIKSLFDLEMRSLPQAASDDERSEVEGTPYEFDRWVLARVSEFIAVKNSVEIARPYYRPILDLGPAAKYWVDDFLRSWLTLGLQISTDLEGFALIWQDMLDYAETLPAWQPGDANYWSRAEELAVNLMGLNESTIALLGQAKYKGLVNAMAPAFERWSRRWLKYASAAGWFAYFIRTESGRTLLPQGVKQLAAVIAALPDREWQHHDLGGLLTEVLASCWKYLQKDVEKDASLREAFLRILAVLSSRQIPEALHLRARVSEVLELS
jgi:hypothetical protein